MRLTILTLLAALAAAPAAEAQTGYIPYYGKNAIRYDNFDWHIYQTDHFEIYYYPEIEQHLERIAGYAESAYQHVSAELKHDLAFKVPLILFTTSAEFWQQNVIPGAAQEGVGAFAEPSRSRMVMPIDEPSDLLYRLITHELTHIFQFDIIPTGLIRRNMPLWTMEGMSDYMTGYWRPLDLMTVRDAAVVRHHPEDERDAGLRRVQQPAPHLQPRARGLRVHGGALGQGRRAQLRLRPAAQRHRRQRRCLRRSLPDVGGGMGPAVRSLHEGPLQAVP